MHCPGCHGASDAIFHHPKLLWCGILMCITCHPNKRWFLCKLCDDYPSKSIHILTAKHLNKHLLSSMHKNALSQLIAAGQTPSVPVLNQPFKNNDAVDSNQNLETDGHGNDTFNLQGSANLSGTESLEDDNVKYENNMSSVTTISEWLGQVQLRGQDPGDFSLLFPSTQELAPRRTKWLDNSVYFEAQHKASHGPMAVVAKALYGSSDSTISHSISPGNCLFEILLAMLASHLTQSQNDMLGALLQYVRHCPSKVGTFLPDGRLELPLKVPLHGKEIRAWYVEGPNSIMELIPRPSIQVLPDGHIYVSIRESISHLLAHGV
jgi:hypothetical protein